MPEDAGPYSGILVLHGSEGGSLPFMQIGARELASHGFAVLAFCWFNCNKDPITGPFDPLKNVELKNTVKALSWLRNSPYVNNKRVGIYGASRGAEQTLILASLLASTPDAPHLIAVHAPSDTVVDGFSWGWMDKRCFYCELGDLSCYRNSNNPAEWIWEKLNWNPVCGDRPPFAGEKMPNAWLWDGTPLVTGTRINIENFPEKVFITHGTKDE